ncbi:LysR family transcriptional regulator [Herbaspirillum huttiense]|uniref:LysR family transcriptional regulator n=1 Tax=Herbaspirillum huttiense TaxID=863372 RepID=UPI0010648157|nr:LysR family transcriptional regulator [Herbaspirillum huttiense]QBP77697.1 LysR family transcriptional regulator [Herbaspirillum huttiense]
MNLTIKQLRAFLTVADTESFNLAAKRLHLTPGAVSLVIKEMEQEVGFSLFDRTTRRVSLSKAGRDFRPSAERVLREMNQAMQTAMDVKNKTTGVVRVAAPLFVASALMPQAIAAYRKIKPRVQVRVVDCAVEELVDAVDSDHVDIAIGPDRATGESVRRISLYETPWVLWCAASNPLARRKKITWAVLARQPSVLASHDYATHVAKALIALPPEQHFMPSYTVTHLSTALGLAAADLAVTLCPAYVGVLAHAFGLVMRRIEEPEVIREMSLYLPSTRALTPAAAAFVDFLTPFLIERATCDRAGMSGK